MIVRVKPSVVKGSIVAAASKSSMQRACAAALVRKGVSIISNPGISNDDQAALGIIREMGCEWSMEKGQLNIDSSKAFIHPPFATHPSSLAIHCGESGLSIRMFSPIVALSEKPVTINGSGSLATRPMDFFDEVLPQLGVAIQSENGKLPLEVRGPLQPATIHIDGSLSSQFLTGLLMAYAASDSAGKSIIVHNLKSKPYIDLTLKVMKDFGLNVPVNHQYESFEFLPSDNGQSTTIHYTVEGDWSGAAFLLVAGAVASPQGIAVRGLDIHSTQADKKILEALRDCGCILSIQTTEIEIAYPSLGMRGFHFDATDCPDLFPPLVALAAYCEGKTSIEGVRRLAHKESNRGLTLQQEFGKMGIQIDLQEDLMIVHGGPVKGAVTHSHHDHRIAMACAVAGLKAEGETDIEEAEAINKSYPNFYEHIKALGAMVSLMESTSMDKEYR